jgi:outer membrane protein assembly factor BamB
MEKSLKRLFYPLVLRLQSRRYYSAAGNVLIYVVVLMLIFGSLGVVMVSMFTSSTASTVTKNDTRRAIYMTESGMRYGFSELRKVGLHERERADVNDYINNTLNSTTYTVTNAGSFTINVFTPWMDSYEKREEPTNEPLKLTARTGTIPLDFLATIPLNNIYVINDSFVGLDASPDIPRDDESAEIDKIVAYSPTFNLDLKDDFNVPKEKQVVFAVKPTQNWTIVDGGNGNLYVTPEAREILPKFDGAIEIRKNHLYYEKRIYDLANNRVELTNIETKGSESSLPMDVTTSDFVILSEKNYRVIPTGKSEDVEYGGNYASGNNLTWVPTRPMSSQADVTADDLTSNLSEQESSPSFFSVDQNLDELYIGGGTSNEFGSAFFDANLMVGGDQNYCVQGACNFRFGVRAFFLLEFNGQGDGITFTLTNAATNNETSAGGDIDLSELMGYGGDSRTQSDGSTFLAVAPEDQGLDPPKIAVEFDTRTNNRIDDPPPDYCVGLNVETNLRNDPLTANKDAVQYVFWGRENSLDIPCRGNSPLYDDNRHDADGEQPKEEWRFEGASAQYSAWRPAIGPDGTIYVSALDATLYALNKDGSQRWTFNLTDNNEYMPAVDPATGTIYSDIFGSALVAINPDGTEKWRFLIVPSSDVGSTPTVGPDGVIYFGTDSSQELIALNPNGTLKWRFATIGAVDNVAALNSDASVVYFVATDPDTLNNDAMLYAVNTADGSFRWQYPLAAENNELTSSPTVDTKGTANPGDDVIYVGDDNNYLYAFRPAARLLDPTAAVPLPLGAGEWRFLTNGEIESSAAIDPNDGTIVIGSDDGNVWAINPNGTEKWRFPTGGEVESTPIIDLDRTIYIGSSDGNVYAINPDGSQKWFFPTGGRVPSSPVLGQDGFIHIGSNDSNFYTISQFGDPRNFKDEDKSAGKLLTFEDLSSTTETVEVSDANDWLDGRPGIKGPYAARLEVNRSLLPNADGNYDYELRLWLRQCNNDVTCDNILGTFFQDTRIEYDYSAVPATLPMIQRFSLSPLEQAEFDRFYFGFTGAAGAEALNATISQFQLSFIRPGDSVVTDDSTNWPP